MNIVKLYFVFLQHPIITIDSRDCPAGSIFFALKGEKFDGNDFIKQALRNGAAFAVGDRADLPKDKRIIRVDNVLKSLQDLAYIHRKQQKNIDVIAITGTNGKTTTKELVAAALSTRYPVLFTEGNLNNHIGVPLTLLRLKPEHRFAIIEMGANHPGEIRDLCRIAEPNYGLITNVGKAHLEGFGSFEGVVRAKTELYDYIREKGGTIFVNTDNPILKDRSENTERIFYGTSREAFVQGRIIDSEDYLELEWRNSCYPVFDEEFQFRVKTQLVGNYNFENVLAAVCIAEFFNNIEALRATARQNNAIADYAPANNRSQSLKTERNTLIIDAYNANPSSMQVALDNFLSLKISPKMVIIGEMKELGEYAPEEHRKLVERLKESAIDKVILCGENFSNIGSITPNRMVVFRHTQELLNYLQSEKFSGFHILIKGSRANQLERAIEFL